MSNQSLILIITKIHIITNKVIIQISLKDKLLKNFTKFSIILSLLSFVLRINNIIIIIICQNKKSFKALKNGWFTERKPIK